MSPDLIYNDRTHYGINRFIGQVIFPSGYITDDAISAAAAIQATKLIHQFVAMWDSAGSVADEQKVIHVAKGAGTIVGVNAGSVAKAVGDAICTFDVKKNGTTILTGVITINSASVNYVGQAGTLAVTTYAAGDCFEVVVDATIGTGTLPVRAFLNLILRENP